MSLISGRTFLFTITEHPTFCRYKKKNSKKNLQLIHIIHNLVGLTLDALMVGCSFLWVLTEKKETFSMINGNEDGTMFMIW